MTYVDGGETWQATKHEGGVSDFTISPDGKTLMLTAQDRRSDLPGKIPDPVLDPDKARPGPESVIQDNRDDPGERGGRRSGIDSVDRPLEE